MLHFENYSHLVSMKTKTGNAQLRNNLLQILTSLKMEFFQEKAVLVVSKMRITFLSGSVLKLMGQTWLCNTLSTIFRSSPYKKE